MVIVVPPGTVSRFQRAWASGGLFLLVGTLLVFAPARADRVDGWVTGPQGVKAVSTHPGYCVSGNLFHRVAEARTPQAALSGTELRDVLDDERCNRAGRPVRVLAGLLIGTGSVTAFRRRGRRNRLEAGELK